VIYPIDLKRMPLPHDFTKRLTEATDEQLYDMLAHDADYLPEALAAARMEIQRRNIGPTLHPQLEARSEAISAQEVQAAQRPLSWPVKIIMFLLPFGLPQILVAAVVAERYRNKGYTRRYKECWTWACYGLGFWIFWGAFLGAIAKSLDFLKVEPPSGELGFFVVYGSSAALSVSVVALIAWFRRLPE
jgi:hypothetical protein